MHEEGASVKKKKKLVIKSSCEVGSKTESELCPCVLVFSPLSSYTVVEVQALSFFSAWKANYYR